MEHSANRMQCASYSTGTQKCFAPKDTHIENTGKDLNHESFFFTIPSRSGIIKLVEKLSRSKQPNRNKTIWQPLVRGLTKSLKSFENKGSAKDNYWACEKKKAKSFFHKRFLYAFPAAMNTAKNNKSDLLQSRCF